MSGRNVSASPMSGCRKTSSTGQAHDRAELDESSRRAGARRPRSRRDTRRAGPSRSSRAPPAGTGTGRSGSRNGRWRSASPNVEQVDERQQASRSRWRTRTSGASGSRTGSPRSSRRGPTAIQIAWRAARPWKRVPVVAEATNSTPSAARRERAAEHDEVDPPSARKGSRDHGVWRPTRRAPTPGAAGTAARRPGRGGAGACRDDAEARLDERLGERRRREVAVAAVLDEDDDDDLRIRRSGRNPTNQACVSSFDLSAPALTVVSWPTTCAVPVLPAHLDALRPASRTPCRPAR